MVHLRKDSTLDIGQLAVSVFSAVISSLLTANIALKRFQREKMWERRADGYTAILEALHEMKAWYEEHEAMLYRDHDMDDDQKAVLSGRYQAAKLQLSRRVGGSKWLFSKEVFERIERLLKEVQMRGIRDWYEVLEGGQYLTSQCIEDIERLARAEINQNGFRYFLNRVRNIFDKVFSKNKN